MRLLRITDRYVLRAFVGAYVPLALTFICLFVIADSFTRLDKFQKAGEPLLRVILSYYAAMLPVLYLRFGAFLTLAAAMFAIARLQRNNELMPIKAGGVSVHRITIPIFACAAVLGLAAAADSEWVIPTMADSIRQASQYSKRKDIVPGLIRDRAGNTLYAGRYRPAVRVLEWVTFRVHDADGRDAIAYFADRARWIDTGRGDGHWLLEDGVIRDLRTGRGGAGPGERPRVEQRRFGAGPEGERIETSVIPIDMESLSEPFSLLSFDELRDQYQRQRYLPRLRVQLHERFTAPLSHVLLLLLGLPFVLRTDSGRGGVFVGMLALLVICAAYFVTTFVLASLGAKGELPAVVAAWSPVVAFGLLGIGLLDRVRT